jgi:hypothetical protein
MVKSQRFGKEDVDASASLHDLLEKGIKATKSKEACSALVRSRLEKTTKERLWVIVAKLAGDHALTTSSHKQEIAEHIMQCYYESGMVCCLSAGSLL